MLRGSATIAWALVAALAGAGEARASDAGLGTLAVRVTDAASAAPIPWAHVRLVGAERALSTDDAGLALFVALPPGIDTLRIARIGYFESVIPVTIAAGESTHARISLARHPVELPAIEVHGAERVRDPVPGSTPVTLEGRALRERVGGTLAATLAGEPSLAERTMGPAPARPVARGLGGHRVLLLEDGRETGDLSATSADHAVVLDPLHAKRIHVVRGPAALLDGSSTLGGVVHVTRELIPRVKPNRIGGHARIHGETASDAAAGETRLAIPFRGFAVHLEATARGAGNVRTPEGDLHNTGSDLWNAAGGIAWFAARGRAGLAAGRDDTRYGIPGGFQGGHTNGVDLDLEREFVRGEADLRLERREGGARLELAGGHSRYYHEELESTGECGVSFGLLETDAAARLHFASGTLLENAQAVVSGSVRDFAQGCLSFIPPTIERSWGIAAYDEGAWKQIFLQGALRFDQRIVEPDRADTNKAGVIRERSFAGVSAALAGSVPIGSRCTLTTTATRSYRPPAIEDLYSEGPHLAAYSYEVGNADLDAETGLGLEVAGEARFQGLRATAAVFAHRFDGFIHSADTGRIEYGPGEEGALELYQTRGQNADFIGGECEMRWRSRPWLELDASTSVVRGTLSETGSPLPFIPPWSGRGGVKVNDGSWVCGVGVRWAAQQDRVGEFETPTAGYAALDVGGEWTRASGGVLHTVDIRVENILDAEYRNHLSRIKSISPEAGRNVIASYQVKF